MIDRGASAGLLPLSQIRVLDLTRAAAGPFCTMILGDLGADVIKVEATPDGDLLRGFGPFVKGEGVYFLSINRNKRSIAIDFRSREGRNLLHELAAKSDVIVENFKPGVTKDMGLDYEAVAKDNDRLIFASITGFGSSGPYGHWPGVDQIAQGMSGTHEPDRDSKVRTNPRRHPDRRFDGRNVGRHRRPWCNRGAHHVRCRAEGGNIASGGDRGPFVRTGTTISQSRRGSRPGRK